MPIYHFHGPAGPDPEPVELENDDTAWSEAVILCGGLLRDCDGALPGTSDWSLQVLDGDGNEVAQITLSFRRRSSGNS